MFGYNVSWQNCIHLCANSILTFAEFLQKKKSRALCLFLLELLVLNPSQPDSPEQK